MAAGHAGALGGPAGGPRDALRRRLPLVRRHGNGIRASPHDRPLAFAHASCSFFRRSCFSQAMEGNFSKLFYVVLLLSLKSGLNSSMLVSCRLIRGASIRIY